MDLVRTNALNELTIESMIIGTNTLFCRCCGVGGCSSKIEDADSDVDEDSYLSQIQTKSSIDKVEGYRGSRTSIHRII